jgi:hypothetical protein
MMASEMTEMLTKNISQKLAAENMNTTGWKSMGMCMVYSVDNIKVCIQQYFTSDKTRQRKETT